MEEMQSRDAVQDPVQEDKTFTQDEVNKIISERLERERSKRDKELLKREEAVSRRELQADVKDYLKSQNLPDEWMQVIDYNTLDEFKEKLEAINSVAAKSIKGYTPKYGKKSEQDSSIARAMGLAEPLK